MPALQVALFPFQRLHLVVDLAQLLALADHGIEDEVQVLEQMARADLPAQEILAQGETVFTGYTDLETESSVLGVKTVEVATPLGTEEKSPSR